MALLDPEAGTIVVRIVYDGSSGSGKTICLRTLAEQLPQHRCGNLESLANRAGRTLYFDLLEFEGGIVEGKSLRCQIISVPGAPILAQRRRVLLSLADVVVFVTGTHSADLHLAAREFATLRPFLTPPGEPPVELLIQANRRTQDGTFRPEVIENRLGGGLEILEATASQGEEVKKVFVHAVRLAVDRVRQMLADRTIPMGPPDSDNRDTLVSLMDELATPYSFTEQESGVETVDLLIDSTGHGPRQGPGHSSEPGPEQSSEHVAMSSTGAKSNLESPFATQKISADRVRAVRALHRSP